MSTIEEPKPQKKVEIRLTEIITASDTRDDIEKKKAGLKASLQRHGVPDGEETIIDDYVSITSRFGDAEIKTEYRALIGTGIGNAIEMTEEQEKRRRQESEEAANKALVAIANHLQPQIAPGANQVVLQEELDKLAAAKDAEAAELLAAKDAELAKANAELEKLKKKNQ